MAVARVTVTHVTQVEAAGGQPETWTIGLTDLQVKLSTSPAQVQLELTGSQLDSDPAHWAAASESTCQLASEQLEREALAAQARG